MDMPTLVVTCFDLQTSARFPIRLFTSHAVPQITPTPQRNHKQFRVTNFLDLILFLCIDTLCLRDLV